MSTLFSSLQHKSIFFTDVVSASFALGFIDVCLLIFVTVVTTLRPRSTGEVMESVPEETMDTIQQLCRL